MPLSQKIIRLIISLNFMKSKGFTLIELLVVIAIIGILASVVLTQVNSARDKTLDVAVKSDLDGIRAGSVVLYDTYGNKYVQAATYTATTGVDCGAAAGQVAGTLFGDPNIALALSHIKKSNGSDPLYCNISTNGAGYAVVAKLKSKTEYVCLDGQGALKTGIGAAATTPYTTTTGATGALLAGTDTVCQ